MPGVPYHGLHGVIVLFNFACIFFIQELYHVYLRILDNSIATFVFRPLGHHLERCDPAKYNMNFVFTTSHGCSHADV